MIQVVGFQLVCPTYLQWDFFGGRRERDVLFCWFPEFPVADGLRPADLKDSTKAGVDEYLDLLRCGNGRCPCFSTIEDRFNGGVEGPDLDADGQVR